MTSTSGFIARLTAPPPALARRMRTALDNVEATPGARPGQRALDAALILTDAILRDGTGSRTGAMTLLAADALVTDAFEALAEAPELIETTAAEAMIRIATTAAGVR